MTDTSKRAWVEIDLSALEHNYKEIRSHLPAGCRFLGVVKADAYSHGALAVSRELERLGADYLAVACLDEAAALRAGGIKMPVLILGTTPAEYARELARLGITQTVCSLDQARELSAALGGMDLKVHIKIDTGMGRLGFRPEDTDAMAEAMRLPGLHAEGVFTHFAVSDEFGDPFTRLQFERFLAAVEAVERAAGQTFDIRHCANTGAVINYRQTCLDMVRPGLALYGHYPAAERGGLDLRPVMSFRARVSAVQEHLPGETISYGRTFTADRPMRVAVVGAGYADGLHRALSGRMDMLINGRRVRQIGRICMDMCMADVTDVPCAPGDVATIFGSEGDASVSVDELAALAGTISYELLCAISPRVPRVYIR